MKTLDKKIVLIVGEADAVAIATGKKLAGKEAVITFCGDNSDAQLEHASTSVRLEGHDSDWIHSALSSRDDAHRVVSQMIAKYGRLDILVINLAAHEKMQPSHRDELDAAPQQAVLSVMQISEAALAVLQKNGQGRIINIGAIDYLGAPEQPGLSAAYSSLFGLTRSLALKVAKNGLTVNAVVKGDIETPAMADEDKESILRAIPVKRMGQPEDVANAISFFAADSAKYVTGQTFFVCGGKSMHYSMSI